MGWQDVAVVFIVCGAVAFRAPAPEGDSPELRARVESEKASSAGSRRWTGVSLSR